MNETLTHLDLFTGIAGFALAAREAGFRTVAFCEIEEFCQKVITQNFITNSSRDDGRTQANGRSKRKRVRQGGEQTAPNSDRSRTSPGRQDDGMGRIQKPAPKIHGDITTVNGRDYAGVTLITGGFPCQPFSHAGKRKGKEDERHLWPQMFRVIKECATECDERGIRRPWVVAENVPGIIAMELDHCITQMEDLGYTCLTLDIPACGVDARHRRHRIWIIAYSDSRGRPRGQFQAARSESLGQTPTNSEGECRSRTGLRERESQQHGFESANGGDAPDSNREGLQPSSQMQTGSELAGWDAVSRSGDRTSSNGQSKRPQGERSSRIKESGTHGGAQLSLRGSSDSGERESKSDVCRILHGLSKGLDRIIVSHNLMGYAAPRITSSEKELQILRHSDDSSEIQRAPGGSGSIPDSDILRSDLHGEGVFNPDAIKSLFEAIPKEELREVWEQAASADSPQGRRQNKQRSQKSEDALREVSHPVALEARQVADYFMLRLREACQQVGHVFNSPNEAAEIWFSLSEDYRDWVLEATWMGIFHSEWPDVPRVVKRAKDRIPRLRGLGNSIVPQVILPILKQIAQIESNGIETYAHQPGAGSETSKTSPVNSERKRQRSADGDPSRQQAARESQHELGGLTETPGDSEPPADLAGGTAEAPGGEHGTSLWG